MTTTDYIWIVAGFVLCAIVGAVLGALATVKAFLIMHQNSLPPEYRTKLKAPRK